jgi:hypothetical protein
MRTAILFLLTALGCLAQGTRPASVRPPCSATVTTNCTPQVSGAGAYVPYVVGGSGANPLGLFVVAGAANAPANAVNLGLLSTGLLKIVVAGQIASFTNPSISDLLSLGSWPWASLSGVPASFTPALHAATHGNAGSDRVTLDYSQITSGAPTIPAAYSSSPAMDGSASAGSSGNFARGDHVHPSDTSRAPTASPTFTGTVTTPITGGGVQCTHVNNAGVLTGTGSDCGTGGGGANSAGYYLVSQASNEPANAVNLGLLTTGLLKTTVAGSVASFSTATAGTDYMGAFSWPANGSIVKMVSGAPTAAVAGTDYVTPSGSITGNAGTATALAALPTACSAGNYPLGILANGNATGCTAANSGTVTHSAGALTNTYVLVGNGGADASVSAAYVDGSNILNNPAGFKSGGAGSGSVQLGGATSGAVTVTAQAAAGTWTLTLPNTPGTNGYALTTDGSGNAAWAAIPTTLPPNGTAGGDLGGTYPNPSVSQIGGAVLPAAGSITKTNSSGQLVAATAGTDYVLPAGSITGNASTATALASTPTTCAAGNYPLGITANGNVTGCTAATGGGGTITGPGSATSGYVPLWGTYPALTLGLPVTQSNGANSIVETGAGGTIAAAAIPTLNQNTTGSSGSVLNALTLNNGGAGAASGSTFNGSAAITLSYNTLGAAPLASPTFTGTVTIPSGASLGTPTTLNVSNATGLTASQVPAALSSTTSVNGTSIPASSALMTTGTTLASGQMPTFTGDVTNSGLAMTVGKVNGAAVPTSKNFLGSNGSGQLVQTTNARAFGYSFNSSSALTTGLTAYGNVPFACTISAWTISLSPADTATVDVWKVATGSAVPTVSNTITASAVPAITTGTSVHSSTLTGWTTSVSANDLFAVNIKAIGGTATFVNLTVECDQ